MSGLGFGKKPEGRDKPATKLDLSGFAPEPAAAAPSADEQARQDRAAARVGFTSREPTDRVQRVRRKASEPLDQVAVKGPLSVINRFKQYANDTELTYAEAITRLLDIAEGRGRQG
jgi:hypothetical protein